MQKNPVAWLVDLLWAALFAVVVATSASGCDPYEDADSNEDVCNDYCTDEDEMTMGCVCGRLVEHLDIGTMTVVTECLCSCGNPEHETTWDWCANPW